MSTLQKFLADENFDGLILNAIRLSLPELDIVRVVDVGLSSKADDLVLTWAATEDRILLTHDIKSMQEIAMQLVELGQSIAGVIEIPRRLRSELIVREIRLIANCSFEGEYRDRLIFLPFSYNL